jgi:tRNA threonylcarbamoyladenosine biosynthesis protein TsaE
MISKSLEETNKIAGEFLLRIQNIHTHTGSALTVGLFGDLGSGKTTFTQAVGNILGIKEVMTSPTFVIEKRYELNQGEAFGIPKASPWSKLIHIDAYRLDSGKEILSLNFKEDLADPNNLILIEWPERIIDALPTNLLKINFKFVSENEREISF